MGKQNISADSIEDVVKSWVEEQIKEGEDPEIIKESLIILNQNPQIVDDVLQEIKKKSRKKEKSKKAHKDKKQEAGKEKEDFDKRIEEIKKEVKKEVLQVPQDNIIEEPKRINIPKEVIPNRESLYVLEHKKPLSALKIKELIFKNKLKNKTNIAIGLIFIGISLILVGVYLYFYF